MPDTGTAVGIQEMFYDRGTTATFTWHGETVIPDANDLRLLDPEEPEEEFGEEEIQYPHQPKKIRLTAREAIALEIKKWMWLAETGTYPEENYRGDGSYISLDPLCTYAEKAAKRFRFNRPTCHYCLYFRLFGERCDSSKVKGKWYGTHSVEDKKKYAGEYLEELLKLQKAIILNPKSVLPRYREA